MSDSNPSAKDGSQVQVVAKAIRRHFTAAFKLRILREAEACSKPGELSALLRREGLYSSHLTDWKKARELGELEALEPKTRGRKPIEVDPRDLKIAELEHQLARLTVRAERAEALVGLQKKLVQMLGRSLEDVQP